MPSRSKKKRAKAAVGTTTVKGQSIEIRATDDGEELWINGEKQRVLRSNDGYNLYGDAYARPHPTLEEAAAAYAEKLAAGKRK